MHAQVAQKPRKKIYQQQSQTHFTSFYFKKGRIVRTLSGR